MGKYRHRLEIVADILYVVNDNNGAKKTKIMYQANLSYDLLVQYLKNVVDAGLITCGSKNCYALTRKGQEFLRKFGEYCDDREKVEKQLNHVEDQKALLEKMLTRRGN